MALKYVIDGVSYDFEPTVTRDATTDAKAQAVMAAIEDLNSAIRPEAYGYGDAYSYGQFVETTGTSL
ncbi:hypothetical protein SEA_HANK144_3 [Streptomyces phage Hank144]|uniref:Uncharacterized protein n=1 Tax=Streptomyces phage Hank144 TaxID=2301573 RepID=A0A385DR16_9CAUD|nr:hypothetical protein KGG76_gp03 [Streptomyces phage Hank144]AXQ61059.1 hypothetical protein SEA_HANK144_3 [Streptomyces phage Hank144]